MDIPENISCLNCSADLDMTKEDLSAFYTLNCSSRVRSTLSSATIELIPIHHALAAVFNLETFSKVFMSKGHDGTDVNVNATLKDFLSKISTAPICFSCYLVLSDLYRSHIEFSQLRKANSLLGSKLKEMENQFRSLKNHESNHTQNQHEFEDDVIENRSYCEERLTALDLVKAEINNDSDWSPYADGSEMNQIENNNGGTEENSTRGDDHLNELWSDFLPVTTIENQEQSQPAFLNLASSPRKKSTSHSKVGDNFLENNRAVNLIEEGTVTRKKRKRSVKSDKNQHINVNLNTTQHLTAAALPPIITLPEPLPCSSALGAGSELKDYEIVNLSDLDDSDAGANGCEIDMVENNNEETAADEGGNSLKTGCPSMVWVGHQEYPESVDEDQLKTTSANGSVKRRSSCGRSKIKSRSDPEWSATLPKWKQKYLHSNEVPYYPSRKIPIWNPNPALNPNPSVLMEKLVSNTVPPKTARSYKKYEFHSVYESLEAAQKFLKNDDNAVWRGGRKDMSSKGMKRYWDCKYNKGTTCPARVYILQCSSTSQDQDQFEIWKATDEHSHGSTAAEIEWKCSDRTLAIVKDLYNSGIRKTRVVRRTLQDKNINLTRKCVRNVIKHVREEMELLHET